MKVDGQASAFLERFNEQRHREATVTRVIPPFNFFRFGFATRFTIDAGAGADVIKISKTGLDDYSVNINGQEFSLTEAEMTNLTISGGSGTEILVDASIDVPITIMAGR